MCPWRCALYNEECGYKPHNVVQHVRDWIIQSNDFMRSFAVRTTPAIWQKVSSGSINGVFHSPIDGLQPGPSVTVVNTISSSSSSSSGSWQDNLGNITWQMSDEDVWRGPSYRLYVWEGKAKFTPIIIILISNNHKLPKIDISNSFWDYGNDMSWTLEKSNFL